MTVNSEAGGGTTPDARTVGDAIRRIAVANPDAVAIVATGFSALTYGGLIAEFDHVGVILRQAGLGPQARVAIALKDAPRAALAIVAVTANAVAVPIDTNLTASEIDGRIRRAGVHAVIVAAGEASPARAVAEQRGVVVIEAASATEGSLRLRLKSGGGNVAADRAGEADPNQAAFILQTSGTTAEPNLIPYAHHNMLATAARVRRWFGLGTEDRCLSVSAVHYCHGLTVTVLAPLLSGGSVAFPLSASRVDVAEWLDALQPTWYSAGPTAHLAILEKVRADGGKEVTHRLKFCVSGGAPLSPEVQAGLQDVLGVPVLEHYGATEAAQISSNLPRVGGAKAGSCGRPDPGTVIILDEEGRPVAAGERGEIFVGGPTVISGYLDAPELNRLAFVDGRFRTGDVGSLDDEGFLSVHGRLKEIINRGGEKVAPAEIDGVLMRHPAVSEAAAFAVPHPRLGEDVGVAVVLRPGATATSEDLRAFLGTQLAWFKVPRRVNIVSALPRGATGKVQRRKLSESYR